MAGRINLRGYDPTLAEEFADQQARMDARQLGQLQEMGQIRAQGISDLGRTAADTVGGAIGGYLEGDRIGRDAEAHKMRMRLAEQDLARSEEEINQLKMGKKINAPVEWTHTGQVDAQNRPLMFNRLTGEYRPGAIAVKQKEERDTKPQLITYTDVQGNTVQEFVEPRAGQKFAGKPPQEKAASDSAKKAAGFAARAVAADEGYNALLQGDAESPGYDPTSAKTAARASLADTPLIGSLFATDKNRKAKQFQDDFVMAILRPQSGATITDAEMENAKRTYFPQPGDTPDVVAQKAATRQREIEALKAQSGATEVATVPQPTPRATAKPGTATATPKAKAPEEMTAAERAAELKRLRGK